MRRAMAVLVGAMLAGCPSTQENTYSRDATAESAVDVGDEGTASDGDVSDAGDGDAGDGDVAETGVDVANDVSADVTGTDRPDAATAPDVEMRIDFVSAALHGGDAGGVTMRATMTWHGTLRGTDGVVSFNGGMR